MYNTIPFYNFSVHHVTEFTTTHLNHIKYASNCQNCKSWDQVLFVHLLPNTIFISVTYILYINKRCLLSNTIFQSIQYFVYIKMYKLNISLLYDQMNTNASKIKQFKGRLSCNVYYVAYPKLLLIYTFIQ